MASRAEAWGYETVVSNRTHTIVEAVIKLARQKNVDPKIAILCKAVLHLYKQTGQLHADDLEAIEQIEELDRRQGPGDV